MSTIVCKFGGSSVADAQKIQNVCNVITRTYDAGNDVTFYEDPALFGQVLLRGGDYVIFAPEDAHKPRCLAGGAMAVKKIVVKVPV